MSDCTSGIHLFHDPSGNIVYKNTIANSKLGINIKDIGLYNQIHSNTIIDATEKPVNIEDSDLEEESILKDNKITSTN